MVAAIVPRARPTVRRMFEALLDATVRVATILAGMVEYLRRPPDDNKKPPAA